MIRLANLALAFLALGLTAGGRACSWELPGGTAPAEVQVLAQVNAARAFVGLEPVVLVESASVHARVWAWVDAQAGELKHAPDITGGAPPGWRLAGEVIGVGGSLEDIMAAWVRSPGHAAIIFDPAYDRAGVGVLPVEGGFWVVLRFFS